ncbi:MAG: methyltransferase domain-containing protein, partial [Lachnospiraceae bacterium]|nr:methyltransferase domain-containing protein [Lachnospiraceae bacterium]
NLPTWDGFMKCLVWRQLGDIRNKKILDFGSGIGVTANYLAEKNQVVAIEPSQEDVENRWKDYHYEQLVGSTDKLRMLESESFDMIICHNVLEYAQDRAEIVKEFARILKGHGVISLVKHNRPGLVMQMVVLLNNFEHAHSLLDGDAGVSSQYGAINYYEDSEVEKWCPKLKIRKTLGMRTFWDLQQNQEIHKDASWQEKMLEVEERVAEIEEYKQIAFFHHLLIEKVR